MELLPSGLLYHCIGIMPFSVLPERDRYLMFGVFIETVYDYAVQQQQMVSIYVWKVEPSTRFKTSIPSCNVIIV